MPGTPPAVTTRRGTGPIRAAIRPGIPTADLILDVDLTTCRYRIYATAWIAAVHTIPDGTAYDVDAVVGTLHTAWNLIDQPGMPGPLSITPRQIGAYDTSWARIDTDIYVPVGLATAMFLPDIDASQPAQGQATVRWTFSKP